jgi:hypothetical protein
LLSTVDSADTAPTQQVSAMFAQVRSALDQQLRVWDRIKNSEIPALNQQLERAHLAPIQVAER